MIGCYRLTFNGPDTWEKAAYHSDAATIKSLDVHQGLLLGEKPELLES